MRLTYSPLLLVFLACSSEPEQAQPEVTQRQRDSAVAASGLPGAQGVGRAIRAADGAEARNAALDSIDP